MDITKIKLPKGYKLKSGVEYDSQLKRYLWCPKPNDLFYSFYIKKIFKYLKWNYKPDNADGYIVALDGYGKVKKLNDKESFWVHNIEVRKCIPVVKV